MLDLIDVEIPLALPGVPGELKIWISTKEAKEPKIDMHDLPSHNKLAKPEGPGFLLKWEVKF